MTLLSHLGHTVPAQPPDVAGRLRTAERSDVDPRVFAVQRLGAVTVGLVLLTFGVLGATGGVGLLSPNGGRYLGMSSNGLLSALPLVVAGVLLGAASRGPRAASTVMIVLGGLFLVSAVVNLTLIGTTVNLLAFDLADVAFSVGVGLLLLTLGAYGRISGNLPATSPYAHPRPVVHEAPDLPTTTEEFAAEAAMRAAEIAVVQHCATADQQRRVRAMAGVHTRDGRRRVWMAFDESAG